MFESLGKLYEIARSSDGYTKLVITVNVPFKTKYLTFCIWDDAQLVYRGTPFKEGDSVRVEYCYQDNFPRFSSMTPKPIDLCPICFCFLEQINTQRMDCRYCSTYAAEQCKERINQSLKLIANSTKNYQHPSRGQWMSFANDSTGEFFNCVVYESSPLFSKVGAFELLNMYTVVGWKENPSFKCSMLDVIDIY